MLHKLKSLGPLKRIVYGTVALAATFMVSVPALTQEASASQVTSRNIQMTTSAAGASASYTVSFNFISTGNTGGIVVDFCDDSPIIGSSTCTLPTGFTITSPAVSGQSTTSGCSLATFTSASTLNSGRTFTLTAASPVNFTTTPCAGSFKFSGVTNPSTSDHPFYARIYTYAAAAGATGYTVANPSSGGAVVDSGGVALSTASTIQITATVMETLTFCVSKAAPAAGCTSLSAPNLTLGHGSPLHLDSTLVDTDTAYTQISSNAQSGVVVKMASSNTSGCTNGGLKSGTNCIPGNGTFAAITAGTAAFGLNVADGTGGTGTVAHSTSPQYGTTGGSYAETSGVTTPPGDQVEQSTAPTNNVNSLFTFGATASSTTQAGTYTANMQLVATGTF